MMRATFDADGIVFAECPFPPASVFPDGRLAYSEIRDVDPDAAPPEIRTRNGETLFISAEQTAEFRDAIADTGLVVARRIDTWELLLEPFLDTEFTIEQQEQTLATLERIEIPRDEVARIRRSVGDSMLAYNFLLWDWVHLGLFDLLTATRRGMTWLSLMHRMRPRRYVEFYWTAMELAERGRNHRSSENPDEPGHALNQAGNDI